MCGFDLAYLLQTPNLLCASALHATMATSSLPLLFLLLISAIANTSARPCKTLFFITSTSFYPIGENSDPNPNPNPHYLTLFITSTSNVHPNRHFNTLFNNHVRLESPLLLEPQIEEEKEARSLSSSSSTPVAVPSSMRDMTKDIVGLVVALLLGMGCGVLTAATMYLIWSLFMPNRFEYDDDDNDTFEKNKMEEYVAIPAKIIDDDDDLKKPANGTVPVAKEVV